MVALGLFTVACVVSWREYVSFLPYAQQAATEFVSAEEEQEDIAPPEEEGSGQRTVVVAQGDTLSSILGAEGIRARDIDRISRTLSKAQNLRALQINQTLLFDIDRTDSGNHLQRMELVDKSGNTVVLIADGESYTVEVRKRVLKTVLRSARGVIETSFSQAASSAGVPLPVAYEASRAMAPVVPPARLQRGTEFEIIYEEKVDQETGRRVGGRTLHCIAIAVNGEQHRIYRFKHHGYYTDQGRSVQQNTLIMPLRNRKTRISSPFGYRTHPLLGCFKRHTGVDYAAQYGTEVRAAAAGRVIMAGVRGGYGLYVRIRHGNGIETAYAHLSAACVSKGAYVTQGQVIGRVGRSGRVTGPHLHYEVIRNSDYVDPLKYISVASSQLSGREMQEFRQMQKDLTLRLAGASVAQESAEA